MRVHGANKEFKLIGFSLVANSSNALWQIDTGIVSGQRRTMRSDMHLN